jgi:exonuclease SbcD
MIKFLHSSDLHLGKVFHDQSLIEDQAVMLEELRLLLEDESYAALVIAGDVYDRSIPSPEAVDLFGAFLGKVKNKRPSLEIIVIPGNHDSASRLGFGREIFARLGIRFGVSVEECDKPVIVERGGECCAFFLLPFLSPGGAFSPQSALVEEAARRMEKARQELALHSPGASSVLVAHLFASGAEEAGSERVFMGNAEHVNISLFKGFDYIALGHLHRCQNIFNNAAGIQATYSGSPLVYSFAEVSSAEQKKCFLSVELKKGAAKVEKIPVKPKRKVTSLSGPFIRFAGDDAELLAAKDDYLEIRLRDRGITENARDILKRRFPHLLSLRQDEALAFISSGVRARVSGDLMRERQDISSDFREFLLGLYGDCPDVSAEIELFNSLLAELDSHDMSGEASL